jgi:hypothetical protein
MASSGRAERNRERQGGPLDRLPGRAKADFFFGVRDIRRDRHGILGSGLGAFLEEGPVRSEDAMSAAV